MNISDLEEAMHEAARKRPVFTLSPATAKSTTVSLAATLKPMMKITAMRQ